MLSYVVYECIHYPPPPTPIVIIVLFVLFTISYQFITIKMYSLGINVLHVVHPG